MKLNGLIITLALALFSTETIRARIVSGHYAGEIDYVYDPYEILELIFGCVPRLGDSVRGGWSYDSNLVGRDYDENLQVSGFFSGAGGFMDAVDSHGRPLAFEIAGNPDIGGGGHGIGANSENNAIVSAHVTYTVPDSGATALMLFSALGVMVILRRARFGVQP